ncbi:MAG TPA: PilT/PilU family type 4a pilus ATPase [Pirellulales bacterium]|nr:PilT/PilU family type 4a pilus ATPase [Pirellulales bacterium]
MNQPQSKPNDIGSMLDALLAECVTLDASDLHIAPDRPAYFRIHGVLAPEAPTPVLSGDVTTAVGEELARRADRPPLAGAGSLDGAVTAPDGTRFRFNVFRRQGKISIALRRLEDRFRTLADLGLPESLYDLCRLPDGLVVVAGPTGAGKSTTLATLIDAINRERRAHIVTIEDPIEYLHEPQLCLVNQRQIGLDTGEFNEALVASLRQDPDVILVGEIRDLDTIRTAITAAETGHLVFTTVHAGDCVGTIERLVSVFPADEQLGVRRQLSLVLRAIVTQHLVVADGERGERDRELNLHVRRQRVVVSEVLTGNSAVNNLIATGKSNQIYSAMESGGSSGMQTIEESLAKLWVAGWLTEEAALSLSRNPAIVRDRAARLLSRSGPVRVNGGSR